MLGPYQGDPKALNKKSYEDSFGISRVSCYTLNLNNYEVVIMAIEDLDKCPYCGSPAGYSYKSVQRYLMVSGWDGEENGEFIALERETKPRCLDCGKYIKDA